MDQKSFQQASLFNIQKIVDDTNKKRQKMERAVQLQQKKIAAHKRGQSLTYDELEEQAHALSPTRVKGSPQEIAHTL